jgi:hypothetical protein
VEHAKHEVRSRIVGSELIETRSRARFDSCAPAHFRPLGLPIYVAGVPAAPFSLLPSRFYLDHSHGLVLAPATLAALPSTRAMPDRDVFYLGIAVSSIPRLKQ